MLNMATSLAEKYASLANTEPVLQDPEENTFFETAARVDDKFEEDDSDLYFGSSQLRQRNAQSLVEQDTRYSGRKISRKTLVHDEDEEETGSDVEQSESDDGDKEEEEEDEEEEVDVDTTRNFKASEAKNTKTAGRTVEKDDDDDNNSKSGSEGESEDITSDNDSEEDMNEDEEDDSTLTLVPETDMVQKFSEINIDREVQKGKAVQAQLVLWDKLLESRIKMQKMLSLSNCLPQHETWQAFIHQGGKEYQDLVRTNKRFIKTLLEKLLLLQEKLLQMNPSTSQMVDEKQGKSEESASDEEIPSDTEEEEDAENDMSEHPATSSSETHKKRKLRDEDLEELLEKRYKSFKLYRNTTIQKWNDKVRLSSGKVGQKSFAAFEQSALKQIEQILNDRDRLRKRTQLKRSTYRVLGKADSQKEDVNETVDVNSQISDKSRKNDHLKDYDQEIFDDDDFYHQLLRELIERKTADVKDPIAISRQWLEIQKLRSKIKKKVDTKASKGRKVRFDVHAKLVNFMAPIDNHEMTDEAKDELFRSLFGKQNIQSS